MIISKKQCLKTLGVFIVAFITFGASGTIAPNIDLSDYKVRYKRPYKIPFPQENLYTFDKALLGKELFFDKRLSKDDSISCSSCHLQNLSWEDGKETPIGINNSKVSRHAPTLLNVAWGELYFWDGRADSLEMQALMPIQDPNEMGQNLEVLVSKLKNIDGYAQQFENVFPESGITAENIAKAIATFERTIVSGMSPFDRWVMGDEDAISKAAKNGFKLFNEKAKCSKCHEGWNFSDFGFHDVGINSDDVGRYGVTGLEQLKYSFKTPTLRNVSRRAPYMHNGSVKSLKEVIDRYNDGFEVRESLSPEIVPLNLSNKEKNELLAFLLTLNSDDLNLMNSEY